MVLESVGQELERSGLSLTSVSAGKAQWLGWLVQRRASYKEIFSRCLLGDAGWWLFRDFALDYFLVAWPQSGWPQAVQDSKVSIASHRAK